MSVGKYINSFLLLLFVVFLASNVFAMRVVTSISMIVIILTTLFKNKSDTGKWMSRKWRNPFFMACCIYFFVQASFLLYTPHIHSSSSEIGIKTALIVAPFCLCCATDFNKFFFEKLMKWYVYIIALFEVICILLAAYRFFILKAPVETFFYHTLVSPFKQHAVYVSILVFVAFVHLLRTVKKNSFTNKLSHLVLILSFVIFILLLSSKLVITFMVLTLGYYFIFPLRNLSDIASLSTVGFGGVAILILITCVSFTNNPISKRYREVLSTNLTLIEQKDFTPNTYFDGIQFRLLEWRFVKEILDEKHAWLTGVSTDAQTLLDGKYKSTHMYIGDGKSADQGYLGYNTHNQFLESILQTGIFGLLAFILLCVNMLYLAMETKSINLYIFTALLLVYAFNESILERQYGIIIFIFFPLLTSLTSKAKSLKNHSKNTGF